MNETIKRTAIIDIDDTLGPSPFKNILHNDNSLLETPEFQKKLKEMPVFPWVKDWNWEQYSQIIPITGRLQRWNGITYSYLREEIVKNAPLVGIINIEWDDTLPTRDDSYNNYVRRKILKTVYHITHLNYYGEHVDVFEDNSEVIGALLALRDLSIFKLTLFWVKDGHLCRWPRCELIFHD